MSKVISGEGSYTLAAWIKPSDLGGNKFLFGQTQQGIHNGIRNGGYLHQAHWGADTNGACGIHATVPEHPLVPQAIYRQCVMPRPPEQQRAAEQ